MKHKTRSLSIILGLLLVLALALAACTAPTQTETTPTEAPAQEEVVATEEPAAPTEQPAEEVAPTEEVAATEEPAPAEEDTLALPREETLYFNGQQWNAVVGWNPYSNSNNNALGIAQQDNARVIMFETPYLYNMLDGQVYPLLADGPFEWNDARTELTFKIKPAAHWSDGTPVTAEDVDFGAMPLPTGRDAWVLPTAWLSRLPDCGRNEYPTLQYADGMVSADAAGPEQAAQNPIH